MAVDLGTFVSEVKQVISFEELSGKTIAIDAYNTIYQFLSIIRQPDGTPLTDSKGRVTSHLSGLFYRTINLLEYNVTPVYVFDGIPHVMKQKTLEARINRRKLALEEWNKAKEQGLVEEARMHAMASTRITKEVVESSKKLLEYMGIAYIQAPGEGEAQASHLVKQGLAYGIASQDYDSFLFGADVVLRNLTISGRRKLPRKNVYVEVKLERTYLKDLLAKIDLTRQQLIWAGMLVGTDFNSGIDKVGPKTALKIVKQEKTLPNIIKYVKEKYNVDMEDSDKVESIFMKPDVNDMSEKDFNNLLKNANPDKAKIIDFMVKEHEFSMDRTAKVADKLLELRGKKGQKGINNWL